MSTSTKVENLPIYQNTSLEDLPGEIWKDLPMLDGFMVSNFGRVMRCQRKFVRSNGFPFTVSKKILKQFKGQFGYFQVNTRKKGKCHSIQVHMLVAIAFLNHKPSGHTMVVDHIDENRENNHLKNLRIISHRKNIARGWRKKRTSKYVGVKKVKKTGRWEANVQINKSVYYLGIYETDFEAHQAYLKKLKEHGATY